MLFVKTEKIKNKKGKLLYFSIITYIFTLNIIIKTIASKESSMIFWRENWINRTMERWNWKLKANIKFKTKKNNKKNKRKEIINFKSKWKLQAKSYFYVKQDDSILISIYFIHFFNQLVIFSFHFLIDWKWDFRILF